MAKQEYTYGPKIMTRYGKIIFSQEATQFMGLTENTHIKLMANYNDSSYYLTIPSCEDNNAFKIKKSGIYYYITCVDLLKSFGLYNPNPTIYELIAEEREHDEPIFRLEKIITVTDPKIGKVFPNREEFRSVITMLNFII